MPVAQFMASMFEFRERPARLLDPGAGVGQLAAAFVERWVNECESELSVTAVELDESLHSALGETLATFPGTTELIAGDYIELAQRCLWRAEGEYDYIIMNPPYAKLNTDSEHRRMVATAAVEVTNLYAAFVTLALRQLAPQGQLVAITPRSWANGPYFRSFRRDLLRLTGLRRVHVYDTRNTAFADSAVLQENVIFHVDRGEHRPSVVITSSTHPGAPEVRSRTVPYSEVVRPGDSDSMLHLSPDQVGADAADAVLRQPDLLKSLGAAVSTGRVVDFRSPQQLRQNHEPGSVPLLYPVHLRKSSIEWPVPGKKPNALFVDDSTRKMLLPSGNYVVIKRFSSKEERRRIVASLLTPADLPDGPIAVENHLNVLHCNNAGLDRDLAMGLVLWLNSSVVDAAFRQFSGHTQVNATDLRSMRFPSRQTLAALGASAGSPVADQHETDRLVGEHVFGQ